MLSGNVLLSRFGVVSWLLLPRGRSTSSRFTAGLMFRLAGRLGFWFRFELRFGFMFAFRFEFKLFRLFRLFRVFTLFGLKAIGCGTFGISLNSSSFCIGPIGALVSRSLAILFSLKKPSGCELVVVVIAVGLIMYLNVFAFIMFKFIRFAFEARLEF